MAVEQAARLAALLAPDLLVSAEPYLSGKVAEPPQGGPCRFVHNDICPITCSSIRPSGGWLA